MRSTVYLIGAGPGAPDLITLRGYRCLQNADVVIFDHLVHPDLLDAAPAHAERIDVGSAAPEPRDQDAICYLLAEKAREGKTVARLKWGDPFLFDQGGEEALFLHEQGVPYEVVPGVPHAIGATAYAGIPITYPGGGDTVTFVRGHEDEGREKAKIDWDGAGDARRHDRVVRGPAAAAEDARRAHRARPIAGRARGDHPSRHAVVAANHHRHAQLAARAAEGAAGRRRPADRRQGRQLPRAPALVRFAAAVRPPRAGDALEGTARRSRGSAALAGRGRDSRHRRPRRSSTACCSIARSISSPSRARRRCSTSPPTSAPIRPSDLLAHTVVAVQGSAAADAATRANISPAVQEPAGPLAAFADAIVNQIQGELMTWSMHVDTQCRRR